MLYGISYNGVDIMAKIRVWINQVRGEPVAIFKKGFQNINVYPLLTPREQKRINKSYEDYLDIIIRKDLAKAIGV